LWIGEEDDIPFPENLIEAQIKMYKEKKKSEEGKDNFIFVCKCFTNDPYENHDSRVT